MILAKGKSRDSKEQYSFPEGHEGLLILNKEGTILRNNKMAAALLGKTTSITLESLATLCAFYQYDNSRIYALNDLPFQITIQTSQVQHNHVLGVILQNQKMRWLSMSSSLTEDGHILVSLFDVTSILPSKPKETEKERRLDLIVSTLDDITFEVMSDGYILNCWTNDNQKLFFDKKEITGNHLWNLFPKDIAQNYLAEIKIAIEKNEVRTIRYPSPFESHRNSWYSIQFKPIPTFRDRVVARVTDISEEVASREKQLINEQKFDQAFHHSAIGMAIVNIHGECLDVNDSFCKMSGYSPEEFSRFKHHNYCHPDELKPYFATLDKFARREIEYQQNERRFLAKNGQYKWYLVTTSAIYSNDNQILFFISQFQDLSAFKSNIYKLEKQKNQLELTTIELERRLQQLEEFNQIVAHNLKGPASNIQMLIQEIHDVEDKSSLDEYLHLLKSSSSNLTDILHELIRILEIQKNEFHVYDHCSFATKIQRVKDQLITDIIHKKAQFTLDLQVSHIYYPSVYLESIFYNLISNALKYTADHTIPKIHISTRKTGNSIYITIKDNGLGIDLDKHKSQLFKFKKIFHRGYDSQGIGLFITRYQIESLGGTIEVESTLNEGSSFIIQLPIKEKTTKSIL